MATRRRPARIDFSELGDTAYPGRLATAWGPALTEPSGVRTLRSRAAQKLTTLGALAPVHSGIPTRAVGYFALEEVDDPEVLEANGIHTRRDHERLAVV